VLVAETLSALLLAASLLVTQAETSEADTAPAEAPRQIADEDAAKVDPAVQRKRDEAQVRKLVAQLDDAKLAQRVAAEKELLAMGPAVLDFLPRVTDRMAAEVKERLGRVRKTLENLEVEAATTATKVTLMGEMGLADALAAISQQTGNQIVGYEASEAKVATDIVEEPFWQALDQILDRGGLGINIYGGQDNTLVLSSRGEAEGERAASKAAYAGVFRFEVVRVVASRDLRNPALNGMRVSLEISWEPRITPISLELPLEAMTAADGSGGALSIDNQVGVLGAAAQAGVSAIELDIPLASPDRSVKSIASLKGQVTATIPGRPETFEFADVGKAREVVQRKAGVTVAVEQVRKNGDVYELRMRVRFDEAANALESHRGWIYNNEAYMVSPTGERIESAGVEATRQEENEVGLAYFFDLEKGPASHKFVYKTPAGITRKPVEFELKDIELP
jgi:hypothetical protein